MAYNQEEYRVSNARITNAKKYPNGFLYILKLKGFDLYKIGVSNKPKRRIRDIKSVLPFESDIVFCKRYIDVYPLEKQLHDLYIENKARKEWFYVYDEDITKLLKMLTTLYAKERVNNQAELKLNM
tara:strand:+ start:394 stop:771 length:378 start_codon:yes stop_codon:yes gene_type:complete